MISLGVPGAGRGHTGGARRHRVTPALGSRSYDVMSAYRSSPLQAGDEVPVGEHTDDDPERHGAPVAAITANGGAGGGTRAA